MARHTPVAELAPPTKIRNMGEVLDFRPLRDKEGRYPGGIAIMDTPFGGIAVTVAYYQDDTSAPEWYATSSSYDLADMDAARAEQARKLAVWG